MDIVCSACVPCCSTSNASPRSQPHSGRHRPSGVMVRLMTTGSMQAPGDTKGNAGARRPYKKDWTTEVAAGNIVHSGRKPGARQPRYKYIRGSMQAKEAAAKERRARAAPQTAAKAAARHPRRTCHALCVCQQLQRLAPMLLDVDAAATPAGPGGGGSRCR